VMDQGRIDQIGGPADLYSNPSNKPTLDRLGRSVSFPAKFDESGVGIATAHLFTSDGPLIEATNVHADDLEPGESCVATIRPEAAQVCSMDNLPSGDEPNIIRGIISVLLFFGDRFEAAIEMPVGGVVRFELPLAGGWREGQPIALRMPKDALHIWRGAQMLVEEAPTPVEDPAAPESEPDDASSEESLDADESEQP